MLRNRNPFCQSIAEYSALHLQILSWNGSQATRRLEYIRENYLTEEKEIISESEILRIDPQPLLDYSQFLFKCMNSTFHLWFTSHPI